MKSSSTRSIVRRMSPHPANPACMLLLLLACAPHASLGRDLRDDTSSGSTVATGTATSSGSDDTTSTAAGGTDGATGTSSTAADASSSDASGSTGADLCAPSAPDDACLACRKQSCCDEWTACEGDDVCTCIATCIADGGDATACETVHCAGPDDAWTHLHQCSATACAAAC